MNLKILFLFILYFSLIGLFFAFSGNTYTDKGYSTDVDFNDSDLTSNETGTGGIFSTGISFARWFKLVFFGIGHPSTIPTWFRTIIIFIQSGVTLFGIGFVVSSIWDG